VRFSMETVLINTAGAAVSQFIALLSRVKLKGMLCLHPIQSYARN
jgi:hypothetical protein